MKKIMAGLAVAGLVAVNAQGVLAQTYYSSSTMHRIEYKDTSSEYSTTNNEKGSRVWSRIQSVNGNNYMNSYQTSSVSLKRVSNTHGHSHGF